MSYVHTQHEAYAPNGCTTLYRICATKVSCPSSEVRCMGFVAVHCHKNFVETVYRTDPTQPCDRGIFVRKLFIGATVLTVERV
jgi:hypothetical protein